MTSSRINNLLGLVSMSFTGSGERDQTRVFPKAYGSAPKPRSSGHVA